MGYRGANAISTGKQIYGGGAGVSSSPSFQESYGRVIDVIVDSSHPQFHALGGTQALYGVFYQPLFQSSPEELVTYEYLRFAYACQHDIREIPVKNEIVALSSMPATDQSEAMSGNAALTKTCWTRIIPVWNHPHVNHYPDTVALSGSVKFDSNFAAEKTVDQLQLLPGDFALEGRYGQSIRFGGTSYASSLFADSASNGYPYTIIRNGTPFEEKVIIYEDVNKDDSSIYLTSNHIVPLSESNRKFAAAKEIPEIARNYRGKQIVLNSDRIFLNAKENDIELAAKKHIGFNSQTVSIDGENYVGLDAKKIYLGSLAKEEYSPVLKGEETVQLLYNTYNALISLLSTLGSSNVNPETWIPTVVMAAKAAESILKSQQAGLDRLKSQKVFVE